MLKLADIASKLFVYIRFSWESLICFSILHINMNSLYNIFYVLHKDFQGKQKALRIFVALLWREYVGIEPTRAALHCLHWF